MKISRLLFLCFVSSALLISVESKAATLGAHQLTLSGPVELVQGQTKSGVSLQATGKVELSYVSLKAGDLIFPGEIIKSGFVVNNGATTAKLRLADGKVIFLSPGQDAMVLAQVKTCSVTCQAGFYACCVNPGIFSSASCTCVANGTTSTCNSGGPGSASCSVSAAAAVPEEPIDQPAGPGNNN